MNGEQTEQERLRMQMALTEMRILLLERQRAEALVAAAATTPAELSAGLDAVNAAFNRRRYRYG
jgi:hypothetical protein